MVAYEIGRQLSEQGEDVKFVAMIDSYLMSSWKSQRDLVSKEDQLIYFLKKENHDFEHKAHESISAANDFDDIIKRAHETGLLSSSDSLEDAIHKIHIGFSIMDAISNYFPEPWAGRVYQLSAEELSTDLSGTLYSNRGWDFMESLQPSVMVIGGNHETIMAPPNLQILAMKISQLISAP